MINFMDAHGGALFTSKPPYIKEGVVMRKHLLENATHKARHREWKECFLVVTEGELKMYALQASSDMERRTMLRASSASFANLADSLSKQNMPASTSFGGTAPNKWAVSSYVHCVIKREKLIVLVTGAISTDRQYSVESYIIECASTTRI